MDLSGFYVGCKYNDCISGGKSEILSLGGEHEQKVIMVFMMPLSTGGKEVFVSSIEFVVTLHTWYLHPHSVEPESLAIFLSSFPSIQVD